jgi:hypothetical protein
MEFLLQKQVVIEFDERVYWESKVTHSSLDDDDDNNDDVAD